jgi:molybdenum cofactor cytidylyltransferase
VKFGPVKTEDAEGAILAHAVRHSGLGLAKGKRLDAGDVARLLDAGIASLTVARLDESDVHEDRAASRAAAHLVGFGISAAEAFTGRVNLYAETSGLLTLDKPAIDALNRLDETITVATLPLHAVVQPRQIVATVKVIPYAAPEAAVAAWEAGKAPLRVAPFRPHRIGLIQSRLPGQKPSLFDKMTAITTERLAALGSSLDFEARVEHKAEDIAAAVTRQFRDGAEIILVIGASAIIDRQDVIPEAIRLAGGEVEHFGMPVDPGNLLLLGRIQGRPVLGLPGCARSPKLNGVDFVLHRLLAGLPLGRPEIMAMGVGGLLTDTPSRPLPRAEIAAPSMPRIAALVLAAGRSSRMGRNKLLIETPTGMLVQRAVDTVLASKARPVIVVTGNDADAVEAALIGRAVSFVRNPDFAAGLATSLARGLYALPENTDGAVICLGDMPDVVPSLIDRLIAAYNPVEGRAIIVPVRSGRRGNPVLWGRRFFDDLRGLAGDTGGKQILARHDDWIAEITAADDGVLTDIDTPEALAHWRLISAYRASTYIAGDEGGTAAARIGSASPEFDALLARHDASCGAFITAWNPGSRLTDAAENLAAGEHLARCVAAEGFKALPGRAEGTDPTWTEHGLLILDIPPKQALDLAERLGQYAVVLMTRDAPARLAMTRIWQEDAAYQSEGSGMPATRVGA